MEMWTGEDQFIVHDQSVYLFSEEELLLAASKQDT
jgi:hypothetical protein